MCIYKEKEICPEVEKFDIRTVAALSDRFICEELAVKGISLGRFNIVENCGNLLGASCLVGIIVS